jgi:plastocyanin
MRGQTTKTGTLALAALALSAGTALAADETIKLKASNADPRKVTIDKGDKVTFKVIAGVHKIKVEDHGRTGRIENPDSVSFKFTKRGEFRWFDKFNGDIKGKITVD